MSTTTNYGFEKPTVGGDFDVWGTKLNTTIDDIDEEIKNRQDSIDVLGVGSFRQKLVNGCMNVWQSGTSFTAATNPANNDDTYLMDQWVLLSDGNDIVDVSQDTDTPAGFEFAAKFLIATINKKFGIFQPITSHNINNLLNEDTSLSFYAKTTASKVINNVRAAIVSWTGTADIITTDIVSAWNASGANPTLIGNWTYENTPSNLALTTSYQRFTIENVNIDTVGTKNIGIFIWVDDTDAALNDELFIAGVQYEKGSIVSDYEHRKFNIEEFMAFYYYQQTAADSAATTWYSKVLAGSVPNGQFYPVNVDFYVPMRIPPTITLFGGEGIGSDGNIYVNSNSRAAVANRVSRYGYARIQNNSGVQWNSGQTMIWNHKANARL
jgi:hypothetical protein